MLQWGINHFDEEDNENFDIWWGQGEEEVEFDW
jgi:hypothetical protein